MGAQHPTRDQRAQYLPLKTQSKCGRGSAINLARGLSSAPKSLRSGPRQDATPPSRPPRQEYPHASHHHLTFENTRGSGLNALASSIRPCFLDLAVALAALLVLSLSYCRNLRHIKGRPRLTKALSLISPQCSGSNSCGQPSGYHAGSPQCFSCLVAALGFGVTFKRTGNGREYSAIF